MSSMIDKDRVGSWASRSSRATASPVTTSRGCGVPYVLTRTILPDRAGRAA